MQAAVVLLLVSHCAKSNNTLHLRLLERDPSVSSGSFHRQFRFYLLLYKLSSCRFLSVLSCKHGPRRSGKVRRRPRQWHVQGRFSMTRVWLSTSFPIIVQS